MTDIATTYNRKLDDSRKPSPVTSATNSTESQVLITEQQVLFTSTAAVALPPAKQVDAGPRPWRSQRREGGIRHIQRRSPTERRHCPARNDFLQDSRMAREMYRL